MKLNIQQQTDDPHPDSSRDVVIFGVSDFQTNNSGSLIVFFPVNTGFATGSGEFKLDARVTAGLEESVMDDLTYSELLIESTDKDHVIVVESDDFPQLHGLVEDLPEDVRNEITVIKPTDMYSQLPL